MANKPWLKQKSENKVIDVMGAKITIKKLNFGESRKAIQGAVVTNPVSKQVSVDQSLASVLRTVAMIDDWDLTDEEDNKLPITVATIDELDEGFASLLIQEVNKQDDSSPSEDEKK